MEQIPSIDRLFPDEWRAFCNGTVAVQVERQEIEFSAAGELCWLDRIFVKGDHISVEI
ncbi:MAG: hypothetical protein MJ033_05885 [Victivallaceae bacterium]|nr:hypothetical protein [Victivallaceae bacterium]